MSGTPSLSDRDEALCVEDRLEFCAKALAYAAPLNEATLTDDAMRYDAIPRNIELIGEASSNVTRCARKEADLLARRVGACRRSPPHRSHCF